MFGAWGGGGGRGSGRVGGGEDKQVDRREHWLGVGRIPHEQQTGSDA